MVKEAPINQAEFPVVNLEAFKKKALLWSKRFPMQCLLDHNGYPNNAEKVTEGMLATQPIDSFAYGSGSKAAGGFASLQKWLDAHDDWAFGFLSYDLKNEVEQLTTGPKDRHAFPLIHFFRPGILLFFQEGSVKIQSAHTPAAKVFAAIENTAEHQYPILPKLALQPNFSKKEYLEIVRKIKGHIQQGDIYEMSFCQSFFAEDVAIDAQATYLALNELSAAPFASFYKLDEKYLLCGSPERFLKKEGSRLLSQPIKGTRPRRAQSAADKLEIKELQQSAKDRSENVMIVDLVRNDLARSCTPGSIQVEELFGIYSFKTVHQMISTISGQLKPGMTALQAIEHAFPMGSMTGAPKIRAMQLIDQYERNARGLYSGAVGYFTPERDFDFNVVIRSILYEEDAQKLSFQVGGAIVADSDPEEEFEECMVKAQTMMQVLGLEQFVADV